MMHIRLLIIVLTFLLSPLVHAEETKDAFHRDLVEVNLSLNAANNYLRTGNLVFADMELETARDKWTELAHVYTHAIPSTYGDKAGFKTLMQKIKIILISAYTKQAEGDPQGARALILPIRDMLHQFRVENGVDILADRVWQSSQFMKKIWTYRDSPPDLSNPAEREALLSLTIAYEEALTAIDQKASADIRQTPEFRRLIDGMQRSLRFMHQAIETRDPQLVHNVLGEMKSFDRILFIRFG